jgi:glucose-1-phosphate thymidylyltransferase
MSWSARSGDIRFSGGIITQEGHDRRGARMRCIILAGGFARRLLPLTEHTPKPLLPVGGRPMLAYTTDKLKALVGLERVYITTNRRFWHHFREFIGTECEGLETELFIEDAEQEGQKLGSVGALHHLVEKAGIHGDCLVIGGDNLFSFELRDLVEFHRKVGASAVALHDVESRQKASLYGIVKLGTDMRIVGFVEKPKDPPSTLASTACYLFNDEAMRMLATYITEGNPPDAAGNFVAWLAGRLAVYGYVFRGWWYDVGSKESYAEADALYWKMRRAGRHA